MVDGRSHVAVQRLKFDAIQLGSKIALASDITEAVVAGVGYLEDFVELGVF